MTAVKRNTFFGNFRRLAERLADETYQLTHWVYNGKPSHGMEDDLEDFLDLFGGIPMHAEDNIVRWRSEYGEEVMLSAVLVAARIFTLFPGKLATVEDVRGKLASQDMQNVRDAAHQPVAAIDKRIAIHGADLRAAGA